MVKGALKRLEIVRSPKGDELRKKLWDNVYALQNGLRDLGFDIGEPEACVTPVYMKGGIGEAANMVVDLRENFRIFCSIVIYPVIPKGVIIFRLIPTAVHSLEDVEETLDAFSSAKQKLEDGVYQREEFIAVTSK